MAQAQLHARTLIAGSDSEPHEIPGFGAIPGSLATRDPRALLEHAKGRGRRRGYSSGVEAVSGVGSVLTSAGRRRAGAGPEYHLREIHMKIGAARKIDE
jgi:hypothetical protein